jgi:hypothetical protein
VQFGWERGGCLAPYKVARDCLASVTPFLAMPGRMPGAASPHATLTLAARTCRWLQCRANDPHPLTSAARTCRRMGSAAARTHLSTLDTSAPLTLTRMPPHIEPVRGYTSRTQPARRCRRSTSLHPGTSSSAGGPTSWSNCGTTMRGSVAQVRVHGAPGVPRPGPGSAGVRPVPLPYRTQPGRLRHGRAGSSAARLGPGHDGRVGVGRVCGRATRGARGAREGPFLLRRP